MGYGSGWYSVKIETVGVVVRFHGAAQPRIFERYEIATSACGLLAMTTPKINFDRLLVV